MDDLELVTKVAILSRIVVISWSVASVLVVGAYDSSAALARNDNDEALLALGLNWDAQYFNSIAADGGYALEQSHAFFPLLPALQRGFWIFVSGDPGDLVPCVAVGGIFISNVAFLFATRALYLLTRQEMEDRKLARAAAVLFAFNPASVFMSAAYTESLFALLSFHGMRIAASSREDFLHRDLLAAAVFFAFATLTRSNGIILSGYLGYRVLRPFFEEKWKTSSWNIFAAGFALLLPFFFAGILPFFSVLRFGYLQFCKEEERETWRPWCNNTFPNIYAFVQAEYWGNGFLKFYEAKQIPNIVLALPMLLWSCLSIAWSAKSRKIWRILPFALHHAFLVVFCLLFMHVHVLTRFVASCPTLYWYGASRTGNKASLITAYSCIYLLLGTAMFSNYYPWA